MLGQLGLADVAIVVCDSLVEHALAQGSYNQRRGECEAGVRILARHRPAIRALRDVGEAELAEHRSELPDDVYRRCRHVVTENARVAAAVAALEARDLTRLGELLRASHESLRGDYAVSCPELDLLVEAALDQPGVHGSRMMGGGFGGSTISLVDPGAVATLGAALGERYRQAYGKEPRVRVCRSADGAGRWG